MSSNNMFYKLLVILIVFVGVVVCARYKAKPPKIHHTSVAKPPQVHRPIGWDPPKPAQTNHRPVGFDVPSHQTHATNLGTSNQGKPPIGWNVPPAQNTNQRPIGFNPPGHGTNVNQQPGGNWGTNQQPHYNPNQQSGTHYYPNQQQQQPGTHWGTNQQPGGHWGTNQQPGGHWGTNQQPGGHWGTNQQPHYNPNQPHWNPNQPGGGGGGYWNNYQHGYTGNNYGGGYGQHGGFFGGGPATYVNKPKSNFFKYTATHTGAGALGFFLGYGLAKMSTPSIHYGGDFNRNYDHYEVHHYYHNKDSVPSYTVIRPNNIDVCAETSSVLCTGNTTALCTTNGTIMCVARSENVVPCSHNSNLNCVKTMIPCVNSTIAGCENNQNSTSIMVPCISNANVFGNITYVNNTIALNSTQNQNQVVVSDGTNSTIITTTPAPTQPAVSQAFCVTIMAVPAASKPSEPKVIYDKHKDVFNTFVKSIWGM